MAEIQHISRPAIKKKCWEIYLHFFNICNLVCDFHSFSTQSLVRVSNVVVTMNRNLTTLTLLNSVCWPTRVATHAQERLSKTVHRTATATASAKGGRQLKDYWEYWGSLQVHRLLRHPMIKYSLSSFHSNGNEFPLKGLFAPRSSENEPTNVPSRRPFFPFEKWCTFNRISHILQEVYFMCMY